MARLIPRLATWVAAILLLGLVSRHSLVAYLDDINPELALAIRGNDARAALAIAQARIVESSGADPAEGDSPSPSIIVPNEALRGRVRRALYFEPMNARALELLGILAANDGDASRAATSMSAALKLSKRSPAALYFCMSRKLAEGDLREVVALADALLRIRPLAVPSIAPILIRVAAETEGANRIADALARSPPWRGRFFRFLNSDPAFASGTLALLLALKTSPEPPTEQEIDPFLWALAAHGKYKLAYAAWLQLLPPDSLGEAKFLFNGSFQFPPTSSPFDWRIPGADGLIAEIAPSDAGPGKNALSLVFGGGRVEFNPISQTLMLPPGRYLLSGALKGEIAGLRGLKWQIACVAPASQNAFAETTMILGKFAGWTPFSLLFEVPLACTAQIVRLILDAHSATERLVSGSVAFTELTIARP
jgi:hypothetical protein